MTPLTEFIPHREDVPTRFCASCRAVLSSGNLMNECWPCCGTWGEVYLTRPQQYDLIADVLVEVH